MNIRTSITAVAVFVTFIACGAEAVADPYATVTEGNTVSFGETGPSGHAQVDVGPIDRGGNPSGIGVSGSHGGISGGVSVGDPGVTVSGGYSSGGTSVGVSVTAGETNTSVEGVVTTDF